MSDAVSDRRGVTILGIYVTDLAFRAGSMPAIGETVAGSAFAMGPGGKGSNQAIAAARAGARVSFISRVGRDSFGDGALALWRAEGIESLVQQDANDATGAAFIYVNEQTGENAIIVAPCVAMKIDRSDVQAAAGHIASAAVFMTQLEQSAQAALLGLEIARAADTLTIFNPAPALPFEESVYRLCDFITPNEHEAAALTGLAVNSVAQARLAGDVLLDKGVGCAVITLGEQGVLLHSRAQSVHIAALRAGTVVDTAGAGDAFNGGFAAALAEGKSALEAARFGNAVAALSVTRAGTAPAMPRRGEVLSLLDGKP
jgi:ribokinase